MEDIKALSLVRQETQNVKYLSNLPVNPEDETNLNVFEKNCKSIIDQAVATITHIAEYAKEIDKQLEQLRVTLNNSTKTVQERLREIFSRKGENVGKQKSNVSVKKSVKTDPNTSNEASHRDAKTVEFTLRLQTIEELKQNIQKSIVLTQKVMHDIDNGIGASVKDVENLKGSISGWMTAEKDKNKEDQRKRDANIQKSEKEEQWRDERRRKEKEDLKQKEEEERRQRENNDRKKKEEEKRLKEENERRIRKEEEKRKLEERRKREEEERNKKMEEEMIQRAEEERLRQEEEDRKLKEEEEKRLKDEEERRQREEEEKRRRKEEEERKRKKKIEEEERLRKQEEERKRIEEDNRRRDPANWKPITYKRPEEQTNAFHRGVCCQVAAMDGILEQEDLECLASDEWREECNPSVLNVNEKLASSIISIDAKSGEKTFPVPMRVYVPHCSISDGSDEITVKMSIDGGEWTEQRPVSVPPAQSGRLGLNYVGIDVCNFKTVKVVAVAKTRSQEFVVDQGGTTQISTVDKNIKLFVPRDTFSKRCKIKLEVQQMKDQSLAFATQYYENCHNVLSTGSVMKITSEAPTDKCIELDLAGNAWNDKKSREKGKYLHVYKCRGDGWKIADSEFKGRNMGISVTLPSRKESYVVMEIEGRPTQPNDEFLKAADELYFHSNTTIVRVIAKQRADNPFIMMIQCVERDRVASRISELETQGYRLGPDTSKEFPLLDGQGITLNCSGNINMEEGSEVKLTFHSYMDTAKQEVFLHVVDEFKQKNSNVYLGNLQFEVMRDTRDGVFYNRHEGSLPLTLPKVEREQTRTPKIQIRFPHYLKALAKFLANRLTTQAKDNTWLDVIYSLDSRRVMDTIRRRAVTRCEIPDNDRQICELILHDWMKSKPVQDDKVKQIIGALRNSQRLSLADECEKFVNFHIKHMSDSRMSEMAKKMEGDWVSLAVTLGLSKEEIDTCRREEGDSNDETSFIMLCKWRVSEVAISSGFDIFNDLLGRLDNSQSNMGLKEYIRHLLIQIK